MEHLRTDQHGQQEHPGSCVRYDENSIDVLSNLFALKQDIPWFHIDLKPSHGLSDNLDPLALTLDNYDGFETKSAGYAMASLSLGDNLSIVPGVRYQNLTTHYTGFRGMEVTRGVQGKDTTVTVSHGLWLPMVHVRFSSRILFLF